MTATAAPAGNATPKQAALVRRFRAGVQPHQEVAGTITATPSTSSFQANVDIPSYGFIRGLWLRVTVTGGAGGTTAAVYKEDAPWSWIQTFQFLDANSQPIIFQITGHDLYLIMKYGGYFASADPQQDEAFTQGGTGGNSVFTVWVPLEIRARDALGSLPNTSANTAYKVILTVAPLSDVFSTNPAPTTPTNITVQMWQDSYWQPNPTDLMGRPQAQTPPSVDTVQYWSKQSFSHAASGQITDPVKRLGYLYRNFIITTRTTTPARSTTMFPDPITLIYEGQQLTIQDRRILRSMLARFYGYTAATGSAGGLDTGVHVFPFNRDFALAPGAELGNGYLPSTTASRVEWQGILNNAGLFDVLINDVSAADQLAITG
jgi:hypothetical protein